MVSEGEVLDRIEKFGDYAKYGLLLVGLGLFVIGALSTFSMRKVQSVWYKRGFKKAKEAIKIAKKPEDG